MTTISPYIPIHLPSQPPPDCLPAPPDRPASVSTNSTVATPYSTYSPFSTLPPSPSQPPHPPLSDSASHSGLSSPVTVFHPLLDPNLTLSASKMRFEFERRDIMFARYIVAILAQRIELGILAPKNGIGFPFTDKEERKKSCRVSGWDLELGFNAHSYRERYPIVLALAAQDLEIRGFMVDKIELEDDGNGIYIKYSLKLP